MSIIYKKKLSLSYGKRKNDQKRSYTLTLPKKALPILGWDFDRLSSKEDSIMCVVDTFGVSGRYVHAGKEGDKDIFQSIPSARLIYYPAEMFEKFPLSHLMERHLQKQKDYDQIVKQGLGMFDFGKKSGLERFSLEELEILKPYIEEDVEKMRELLDIRKSSLYEVKQKIKDLKKIERELKRKEKEYKGAEKNTQKNKK